MKNNFWDEFPGNPNRALDGLFHVANIQTTPARQLFPENRKSFGRKFQEGQALDRLGDCETICAGCDWLFVKNFCAG